MDTNGKLDSIKEDLNEIKNQLHNLDKKIAVLYETTKHQEEKINNNTDTIKILESKVYMAVGIAITLSAGIGLLIQGGFI